jgi:hypothetical protein
MSTAAQINANRINSQSSTGPSEAGLAKTRLNALKNALTGQTVVLPDDDVEAYVNLGESINAQYRPANDREARLVQSIFQSEWRLMRIPALENNILAGGRVELAGDVPSHLLPGQVYLKYERSLKNLNIQENRLRRNRDKDMARLEALQAARLEQEAAAQKTQEQQAKQQPKQQPTSHPQPKETETPIGFEFSSAEKAQAATVGGTTQKAA